MGVLVDANSLSNRNNSTAIGPDGTGGNLYAGQSFTGDGSILDRAVFYLEIAAGQNVAGNVFAYIYAHAGTYGTNGTPTGGVLATSDVLNASSFPTSINLVTFTFSGANRISLSKGTNYFVVVDASSVTGNGGFRSVSLGNDSTSPTASGNRALSVDGSTWSTSSTNDIIFYIYGGVPTDFPTHFYSKQGFQ